MTAAKILTATAVLVAVCFTLSAQPRKMSIREFRDMDDSDTTTCAISGIVKLIRNYDRGNLYLKDDTAEVLIYGTLDADGKRNFRSLDIRVGDSLTLVGRRTLYERTTVEMKDARCMSKVCSSFHDRMPADQIKPDKMPLFKGKSAGTFSQWVSARLRFPQEARNNFMDGTVLLHFIVDVDGSLTDIIVLESPHPSLTREAIRVVSSSPRWTPGKKNDTPVRVSFTIPVIFVNPNN